MNTSNFDLRTSSSGSGISRIGVLAGVGLIRAYQLVLAPFTGGACRFHPTCSEYAREAVEEHGLVRGIGLAIRRVWRCHPFAQPGIDPVPPRTGFQATRPQPETCSRRP